MRAASPTTARGIGIGSPRTELLAAYPGLQSLTTFYGSCTPPTFGTQYGVEDDGGDWLVFVLDELAQVAEIGMS